MHGFGSLLEIHRSGKLRTLRARLKALEALEAALRAQEKNLELALRDDLGKPPMESFVSETALLLEELHFTRKRLADWMRPQKVSSPIAILPARSEIRYEPKGPVLILSPWNYPLMLALTPVIGALAAGNPVLVKPSEFTPHTNRALQALLRGAFPGGEVLLVEGGAETAQELLQLPWGHVFFTGSTAVGRKVYAALAKNLVPVTLELGGKSPCIVDKSADLKVSAKRIVWGKCLNAGQTCVAPDMLFVDKSVEQTLLKKLREELGRSFGESAIRHPDYARLIHERHFERLSSFLAEGEILAGGRTDRSMLQIEPTLIRPKNEDGPLWKEEIFGPLLPFVSYSGQEELHGYLQRLESPLAFYVFSRDEEFTERLLEKFPSGGACVNDMLVHLSNPRLPFGGVGSSGLGRYHGFYSFECFSHARAVLRNRFLPDLPLRYRPYAKHLPLIRKILG